MLPKQKYVCHSKEYTTEAQFQIYFLFGAMMYLIDLSDIY